MAPLVGYSIAMIFGFSPEVAAGIILIGSVSSGVASNVITYLASGNVPLSVTITACTTLFSPFVTPFWMKILAEKLIQVDFVAMMFSIFNMIIVPIFAGLIANKILYSPKKGARQSRPLALVSAISIVLAVATLFLPKHFLGPLTTIKPGIFLGFVLISLVSLAKLIVSNLLKGPENWMDRSLPVVSMFGTCVIIAIITARSRDQLLTVGVMLIFAAIFHNATGYFLGYWGARLARLDESACRTVAIEVGMQNGGMATGIAMDVLKSASAVLAPAIFGPWMNYLDPYWLPSGVTSPCKNHKSILSGFVAKSGVIVLEQDNDFPVGGQACPCMFLTKPTRPLGLRTHRDRPGPIYYRIFASFFALPHFSQQSPSFP